MFEYRKKIIDYLSSTWDCPIGWFDYKNDCYFFSSSPKKNWKDALFSCQKYEGNLLSIEDENENAFILNFLENGNVNHFWIGLKALPRKYVWSDNTSLLFFNWSNTEPDNNGGIENCVKISTDGWIDNYCNNSFGFICKAKRSHVNCSNGFRDYCYIFSSTDATFVEQNWNDSLSSCQKYGGNLLSISDEAENSFILNFIKNDSFKEKHFWIGLYALQRTFVWSDNTSSEFSSWSDGQPDNSNGTQDCVVISRNGWNDRTCALNYGFICKVKKVSLLKLASNQISPQASDNRNKVVVPVLVTLFVLLSILFVIIALRVYKKKVKCKKSKQMHSFDSDMDCEKLSVDDWEIFPENFVFDKKVGEGAFGTVFIAKINHKVLSKRFKTYHKYGDVLPDIKEVNVVNVAVKLLKDSADPSEYNDFCEEINLMKGIGYHKNILNMIGCSTIKKPLCLIVEYMENGDLLSFLRKRRTKLFASKVDAECKVDGAASFIYTQSYQNTLETIISENYSSEVMPNEIAVDEIGNITPEDLLCFAWQVASGMEYLSCIKLVHRDLAARNILVGAEKNIKISDFGLTRKVNDELNYLGSKNRRLPVKWMSVEAIFDQTFTSYSDVWAYGVVLYEIVTLGGTPYPSINNCELLALLKSGYRMDRPENCSELLYDIMLHCWNEDPLKRPTFTEIRERFDEIISQNESYFNFEIDEKNMFYNVASFKSLSSETGMALQEKTLQVSLHSESNKDVEITNEKQIYFSNENFASPEFSKSEIKTSPSAGLFNYAFHEEITEI
ncbi:myoblast growth factor receptor egl-15-like isoform X2 [Hydra vulgaris]|uniref:Myoblast growth factor receptor egl-15-like isoform X2 n=1 Tax=Hydra vulgaris TaxID=6087 RepID=A0ABM4CFQ7_HYDVU